MDKAEFKKLVEKHLRIKIEDAPGRIQISLMFDDEYISYDYLDYSEVVRVVKRLNEGEYQ
jgi:hypothetical protein